MSCPSEQILLSDFIKKVHKQLRKNVETVGTEKAWQEHCCNKEILNKYAQTMKTLAVKYWERSTLDSKTISRIEWIYKSSLKYLEEIDKFRSKELKLLSDFTNVKLIFPNEKLQWKLLDVGSCYNPFKNFDSFKVTAIDIAPAQEDVFLCDFLNVKITDRCLIENNTILEFNKESFHIVVFSLLLEYFPEPKLRLMCCEKAYNLLCPEGILVIATPDSNHVGSNAKIFKSWKYVLSKIGFNRIQYEKLPHLHCMIFRKTFTKDVANLLRKVYGKYDFYDEIFIPQDFQISDNDCKMSTCENECKNSMDLKWDSDTFLNDFADESIK